MKKSVKNTFAASGLMLVVNFTACETAPKEPIKTIIPPRIELTQPSFDGNEQNSGILDYVDGKGFHITKTALLRYQGLVSIYGVKEIPSVDPNSGVTDNKDGTFFVSDEVIVRFMDYTSKKVNGR